MLILCFAINSKSTPSYCILLHPTSSYCDCDEDDDDDGDDEDDDDDGDGDGDD